MLSDDGSDIEDVHTLTINEHYAKAFEYRKEREELAKLKEKYGSDVDEDGIDSEDSEEAVSEDEDGEELTPAMDAAILRTLARIKRKDPAIYESGKDVFEEERKRTGEISLGKRQKDKSKPVTLRQHALASALEEASGSRSPSPQPLTHVQEQSKLRVETIAAFHSAVDVKDEEDSDEDGLLVLREKTKDEIEEEEEEYRAYLQREVGEDLSGLITVERDAAAGTGDADAEESQVESPKKKKSKKKKPKDAKSKQEEDQEFLMNYILNRGWIDRSARRLPTYKEITGSKKGKGKETAGSEAGDATSSDEGENTSEDDAKQVATIDDEDEFDEVADRFESSYNFRFEEPHNFRFEEPGAAEIPRYPRNLDSTVRRTDTARKEAREKRRIRKAEEWLKKKEEMKRLKALKFKEIRAKFERIAREGGKKLDESEALQALDLDGDFDPEEHDRQMAQVYADDSATYGEDDIVDDKKPTWDDDIDIADIVPPDSDHDDDDDGSSKKKKKKKKKKGAEEDGFDDGGVDVDDMDADIEHDPADDEEWDGTEEMRKRKLEEYMDEVYGLDFNDMAGGMPTRFRYTKVESQTFGLDPAEILMATDAELNSYMGIKKYAPYRKEGKGRTWDARRTARLKELKTKLQERGIDGSGEGRAGGEEKVKKRKGKKERMREKAAAAAAADAGDEKEAQPEKKRKWEGEQEETQQQQDVAAEGSTKKKRRRIRKTVAASSDS